MRMRKEFSREFKKEAVRLLEEGKKPGDDLARELGIRRNQLYKWKETMDTPKSCNPLKIIILSLILLIFTPQVGYTQTATLDLTWDSNSEHGLAGYKVHYGISPSLGTTIAVNLGDARLSCDSSSCSFELPGLVVGKTYYVAITAYDTSDNESEKSNVASGVAHLPTTPTPTTTTTTTTTPGPVTTSTPGPVTTSTPGPVTTSTPGPVNHHNHHLRFSPWFHNHQQR